jgi:hypothetical protein
MELFGAAQEPALQSLIANALFSKGLSYGKAMNREAANAAYDELLSRYAGSDDPELKSLVGMANFNKGVSYHF